MYYNNIISRWAPIFMDLTVKQIHQIKCLLMSTICSIHITLYFTKSTKIDANTNWWNLLFNVVVVVYSKPSHVVNVYKLKDYRILYS